MTRKVPRYNIPTRNASILGYGVLRSDGRRAERRRPAPSLLGNKTLKAEALAIPYGTGNNLTDRQKMILCYLPPYERHRRATTVFNGRGEWYTKYKYMTTMSDDFLAMVKMPRMAVPRALSDRPATRNTGQVALEEADIARRYATGGPPMPVYGRNEASRAEITSNVNPLGLAPRTSAAMAPPPVPAHIYHLEVSMIPDLTDEEAFQYLVPRAEKDLFFSTVTIDLQTMGYEEVCDTILRAFGFDKQGPAEMFVNELLVGWANPTTGVKTWDQAYEGNWNDEIVPFMSSRPRSQLAMSFGVAVAEEFAEEPCIDPALLDE